MKYSIKRLRIQQIIKTKILLRLLKILLAVQQFADNPVENWIITIEQSLN